ncbi:17-beta-hydroxysteroid dehydrogenase type 6-like [Eublepharis macularius]|uniref:17-beta-hydroxysteroid dehydrogenase type 6-like n=1 Tax=Eublepharis macularius TaxID=481883 RepID=A0AA97JA03_EUBMA|nr:17-beta-hydroxysteroid dehydrogenase type 6-like [Eublepharis macularius]
MWFYLAALLGIYFLRRWYRERQTVENLSEKYVFITGCDSGFGHQLARQLDSKGMRVLAACFTQKGAEQLEKVTSDRLKTTILDVTITESVAAAADWVKRCVGDKGLWGLVNNAGVGQPSGLNQWLTKDDFAKIINVNLLGLIDVTLQLLPLVKKARGRVVNVSSMEGRLSVFGGGYSLSKHGVEAFSDSLRRELHHFKVRVCIIEPSIFLTSMTSNLLEEFGNIWKRVPSDIKEVYGQKYFETCCKRCELFLSLANKNLCMITDCMEHGLTSSYPRTRYTTGWLSTALIILASLPTAIRDYIIIWSYPKPAQAV